MIKEIHGPIEDISEEIADLVDLLFDTCWREERGYCVSWLIAFQLTIFQMLYEECAPGERQNLIDIFKSSLCNGIDSIAQRNIGEDDTRASSEVY